MELTIGSQVVRNTSGVLMVQGKEQLCLEWGPERHQLLLTMNLYNTGGKRVARLRGSEWRSRPSTAALRVKPGPGR